MRDFFVHQKGHKNVTIGGVKLLIDFLPERIVLRASGAEITVEGEGLEIQRFDENEIQIEGKVTAILTEVTRR